MDQKILCEVNNCSYWGRGNKCTADAIYVVSHTGETAEKVKKRIAKPLNRMIYKRKELFYTALFHFRAASLFEISP